MYKAAQIYRCALGMKFSYLSTYATDDFARSFFTARSDLLVAVLPSAARVFLLLRQPSCDASWK